MFCSNCGTELPEEAKFCWKCGTQVQKFISVSGKAGVTQTEPTSIPVVGQKEFRSISCATGGCNNPVIGQMLLYLIYEYA